MNSFDETIAALSSAPGKAGVAVIRISGDDAIECVSRVFFSKSGKALQSCMARTAIYGEIICDGVKIDTGLCTIFKAPNSYTGEDTCEICVHGSEVGTAMLLSALYQNGARPAQAGEFTKRAFLNGKLTLSQAEAVGELIDAQSRGAQILSNAQVNGALSVKIDALCSKLNEILSSIYAFIDYPDEDLTDMSKEEIVLAVKQVLCEVERLVQGYDVGRAISEGIACTIAGSPNVGKSSFLNLLCGKDRAIVTDIAGTTRDVITETVSIGNVRLNLADTAGIREKESDTDDEIEKIGIRRSVEQIEACEVVFALFDASRPLDSADLAFLNSITGYEKNKNVIYILNKCDKSDICKQTQEKFSNKQNVVHFSAKSGQGLDKLKGIIERLYPVGNGQLQEGLIISSARQYASLCQAKQSLEQALDTLNAYTGDLAGFDLEKAFELLGQTDGRSVNEQIVSQIFSRFCVGK